MVLSSHQSAKEVEETVFHELHGHAGVIKLCGHSITKNLDDLYTLVGEAKALFATAKANDTNMFVYIDSLVAYTRLNDKQRRRYLVEELLGHLAEKGPIVKRRVVEPMSALRQWLRVRGFCAWLSTTTKILRISYPRFVVRPPPTSRSRRPVRSAARRYSAASS